MHPCVNDVNDGCLATGEGTTKKGFRVPGRNRTHDQDDADHMRPCGELQVHCTC